MPFTLRTTLCETRDALHVLQRTLFVRGHTAAMEEIDSLIGVAQDKAVQAIGAIDQAEFRRPILVVVANPADPAAIVLPIAQAVEYLGQHIDGQRCALTGEGAYRFREHFERALGERVQVQTKLSRYLAASVAQLGRERIGAGARDDLSELTPAYVSLSQPEVKRQLADKLSV